MTKRWTVLVSSLAVASACLANEDAFSRMHIYPISFTPMFERAIEGKTNMLFIQPSYGWGTGFTNPGVLVAYGMRPSADDYKGATLFHARLDRWDPDAGDTMDSQQFTVNHMFTGKDSPYMMGGTLYYWNANDVGKGFGGNIEVGTMLFASDKDPGWMVSGGFNYATFDPEAGDTTRGAGLSISIGRPLGEDLMVEYDHTFASKFGGAPDWFFRTTWDAKAGTQVRLTVGKGEVYRLELGFLVNTK